MEKTLIQIISNPVILSLLILGITIVLSVAPAQTYKIIGLLKGRNTENKDSILEELKSVKESITELKGRSNKDMLDQLNSIEETLKHIETSLQGNKNSYNTSQEKLEMMIDNLKMRLSEIYDTSNLLREEIRQIKYKIENIEDILHVRRKSTEDKI